MSQQVTLVSESGAADFAGIAGYLLSRPLTTGILSGVGSRSLRAG